MPARTIPVLPVAYVGEPDIPPDMPLRHYATHRPHRRTMATRLTIAQTWRRRRDRAEFTVRMVHRADRQAEMQRPGEIVLVAFRELARKWNQVA